MSFVLTLIPFFLVPVFVYTIIPMVISIIFTKDLVTPSVNVVVFLVLGFIVWLRLKKKYHSMNSIKGHKRFVRMWIFFGVLPSVTILILSIGFLKNLNDLTDRITGKLNTANHMSRTEAKQICKNAYLSESDLSSKVFDETVPSEEIESCVTKLVSVYQICRKEIRDKGDLSSNPLKGVSFDDAVGECMILKTEPSSMRDSD